MESCGKNQLFKLFSTSSIKPPHDISSFSVIKGINVKSFFLKDSGI
ncbi:MAG: hypothetical protein IAC54_07635 [Bacteroidetes bacterium]|uniref:Uncharacterized protein n=1 Tax=Candidatus Caccoplasma merdipullorum TaxID=2840718 RepID=A0A9D9E807_9BACT|nr:hypothetical protein [Candidatus Caccoplasma merdipullorum]